MPNLNGRLRILLVGPENFLTEHHGGISTYLLDLASYCTHHGHQVVLLIPGNYSKTIIQDGFTIVVRKSLPFFGGNKTIISLIQRKLFRVIEVLFPDFAWLIAWSMSVAQYCVEEEAFDVLETSDWHNCVPLVKWHCRQLPMITRLHRSTMFYLRDNHLAISPSSYLIHLFEMGGLLLSDGVYSPNRFMELKYKQILRWYSKKRTVIPYGITLNVSIKKESDATQQPYILFAGRIEKAKGCFILLQAFERIAKKYPHLHLYFVGEDTDMQRKRIRQQFLRS